MQIKKRIRGSFDHFSFGVLLVVAAFAVSGSSLRAATVTKADNTDNLNLGSSWVGGVRPAVTDIIIWNSTVTGANTVSLGAANLLIGTVQIANPGGPVTLNGIGTLQLGANGIPGIGIDMSSATADLTINANIALEDSPIDSSWTVAEGRTLTIAGNVSENGPAEKILTITGAGVTRITGIISDDKKDDLSITKSGTGTLILAAANAYSGDTTVNQGVLRISNSAALGKAPGTTIVNSGGELQLLGNISIGSREDISVTGTGAGGPGSAAIRNISGGNQFNGNITLQDAAGVVRINSDSGSLAFLGNILEEGDSDKILTFGGSGEIIVSGVIGGGGDIALAKDGTGTLILSGNNSFAGPATITGGEVILNGNGGISLLRRGVRAASAGITVSNAALTLDNTLDNKNDRIGNRQVTLNSGTFSFIHGPTTANFTETIGGTLIINSGASTIRTDASADGGKSILTFNALARSVGATVNFGGGTSNPSSANDNNNVRFNLQGSGLIGAWATVGGTAFATYDGGKASGTDSVEALATYEQTLTRLSSGTKSISSNAINNIQITDGTGTAGNITLSAPTVTTINTLTNSATGTTGPAGGVTINPAGQTLQVNGILNAAGASVLTIGTGTNNGTLTAKSAGGELVLQNFSSNALTVNSVIADNSTASPLTTAGTGMLSLTAANTYTGATTISSGVVHIENGAALGTAAAGTTVASGATLEIAHTTGLTVTGEALTLNGTGTTDSGALRNVSGDNIWTGVITLFTDSSIGVDSGSFTATGVIGESGGARSLTKAGDGTLILSGANTYTGATMINTGAILIRSSAALGGTTGGTTVATGSELQIANDIAVGAEPLTLNGSGVAGAGALRNVSDINSFAGPVTLASGTTIGADSGVLTLSGGLNAGANTLTIVGDGNVEITGVVSSAGASIVKNGTGRLTLAAANTYTGATTISSGVVHIENGAALGTPAAGTTVANGAMLEIEHATGITVTGEALILNGTGTLESGALRNVSGDNIWTGAITLFTDTSIGVDSGSFTATGVIGESGGARSLTKVGEGTLILSGANTYTGATILEGGIIKLTAVERLANASALILGSGTLFDMNGFSETIGSLAGSGDVDFGMVAGTTLTVGGDNTNTEFLGGIFGTGSLVKGGTGTLILSGGSGYMGSTTINSGTLAITSGAALGAGGSLIFNGGNLKTLAPTNLDQPVVLNAPATIETDAGAGLVLSGSISGTSTLTKAGPGTMFIAGSGTTPILITGGTINVTGSNSGFINVGSGGTLGGTGITGSIAALDGSTISPGPITGTLNTGNLSLQAISSLHIEIAGSGLGEYDSVNVTGTVAIAGNLTGDLLNGFVPTRVAPSAYQLGGPNLGLEKFFIVVNDGADAVSGVFANQITTGNPFGGAVPTIFIDDQEFAISYTGESGSNSTSGGNDIVLVALVPEPGSLGILLAGSALLGFAHRSRRRR